MRTRLFRAVLLPAFSLAASLAYEPAKTEALMASSAGHLLDSLDRMQRMGTVFKFDSPERTRWHFFPETGFHDEYGYVATASRSTR